MGIKTRLQDKRMDKKLFVRLAYDSLMSDELKMACRDVLVNGFTQGEAARDLAHARGARLFIRCVNGGRAATHTHTRAFRALCQRRAAGTHHCMSS